MRARARVLMDPREASLRRAQQLDRQADSASPSARVAALAASAQASLVLRDLPRADAALDAALRLVAGSPSSDTRALRAVHLLQAQTMLVRGDAARAAAALRPYADDDSRPLLLMRTQVALGAASGPAGAETLQALRHTAEDLQGWVGSHALDAGAWSLLAQAWERLGQPLRALRADAESRAALGDIVGAVDRLRAGQNRVRAGSEFIEASVIDTRLRELEAQRRQLAADLRNNR
jgi:predicted Zn-dependent protease